ncbi:hypothetical protein BN2364_3424 [Alloalcanivorax xenomutans]|nr:hypothetical protein BN2364_3424 [Alloalcanivorax xenomutans]
MMVATRKISRALPHTRATEATPIHTNLPVLPRGCPGVPFGVQ